MKILAAAVQMQSTLGRPEWNLDQADTYLKAAVNQGAELVVLPELFCCGYGFGTSYSTLAGGTNDRVVSHLSERSRQWRDLQRHHILPSRWPCSLLLKTKSGFLGTFRISQRSPGHHRRNTLGPSRAGDLCRYDLQACLARISWPDRSGDRLKRMA